MRLYRNSSMSTSGPKSDTVFFVRDADMIWGNCKFWQFSIISGNWPSCHCACAENGYLWASGGKYDTTILSVVLDFLIWSDISAIWGRLLSIISMDELKSSLLLFPVYFIYLSRKCVTLFARHVHISHQVWSWHGRPLPSYSILPADRPTLCDLFTMGQWSYSYILTY